MVAMCFIYYKNYCGIIVYETASGLNNLITCEYNLNTMTQFDFPKDYCDIKKYNLSVEINLSC